MHLLDWLIDALPVTFLAMVAVAADSWIRPDGQRRHWFLRVSIVTVFLLPLLLVPAYELLIAVSTQMLLILGGLAAWRTWKSRQLPSDEVSGMSPNNPRWRPRISLGALLLATVPLAIAMAVLGGFPALHWKQWLDWIGVGVLTGGVSLIAVALASSRMRLPWRIVVGILFCIVVSFGVAITQRVNRVSQHGTQLSRLTLDNLLPTDLLAWAGGPWLHYGMSLAIALAISGAWLAAIGRTGWFAPPTRRAMGDALPQPTATTRQQRIARWAMLAIFASTLALPLVVFVKLLSPSPLPEQPTTVPANFAHFYEASRMLGVGTQEFLDDYRQLTEEESAEKWISLTPIFERMRRGFSEADETEGAVEIETERIDQLKVICAFRLRYADDVGDVPTIVKAVLDFVQLNHYHDHEVGEFRSRNAQNLPARTLTGASRRLRDRIHELTAAQREEILSVLFPLATKVETWETLLHRRRARDENVGWQLHLHVILDNWRGHERFAENRQTYLHNVTTVQVFLTELALLSYQDDHGHFPDDLDELVPNYFPHLLNDPYGDDSHADGSAPLKYRRTGDTYLLYSVGPNGTDNGGQTAATDEEGDLLPDTLFQMNAP